jgi:hypothetical protein
MQIHFNHTSSEPVNHTSSEPVKNREELRPSMSGAAQRTNPFGSSYLGLPGSHSSAAGGGWTGFIRSLCVSGAHTKTERAANDNFYALAA